MVVRGGIDNNFKLYKKCKTKKKKGDGDQKEARRWPFPSDNLTGSPKTPDKVVIVGGVSEYPIASFPLFFCFFLNFIF